jgi:hypothetical protein
MHAAEVFFVDLLSHDQIRMRVPSVMARAQAVLDAKDPRRLDVDRLQDILTNDELCRAHFKEAMRASFQAEDRIYLRIRSFRNLVVKCTLLLFVLVVVMIWLVAAHPRSMPLCAFTAVTGLLLLGGNFVPGLSELDNQRQILAYALAFGYAQQLISRLVDARARTIFNQLPHASPSPSTEPA